MPKRAAVNVEMPLEFTLFIPTYRLVVAVAYRFAAAYVKFVGTHAQYDAVDAAAVEPSR